MQVGHKWVNQFLTHRTHYANFGFWVDPPLDPQGHKTRWVTQYTKAECVAALQTHGLIREYRNLVQNRYFNWNIHSKVNTKL
jgi:hypothetical protein